MVEEVDTYEIVVLFLVARWLKMRIGQERGCKIKSHFQAITYYYFIIKMADIECVFESMTSRGSIFISNLQAAENVQLLHSMGIKAILSVARSGFLKHSKEDIPFYLYIPAEDHEDYQLHRFFEETYNFIERCRKETNVLVHCKVGVSRSVTIVIAYLIKKYKYSLGQVITMVIRRRNKINPNKGFLEQLKNYAEAEGIKSDLETNYIENLRYKSHSKKRNSYSAQKEKYPLKKQLNPLASSALVGQMKERLQDSTKKYESVILERKEDILKPLTELRKGRSFDQNYSQSKEIENAEIQQIKDGKQPNQRIAARKSVSTVEQPKPKKRLSIEEKISKIRGKILKKEYTSVQTSPKLKTSQDDKKEQIKLTEISFMRSNRFYNTEERGSIPTKNNLNSLLYSHQSKNNSFQLKPSFLMKDEMSEKGDIFAIAMDIDNSTLYSNTPKIHRSRVNSKLAPQLHH